MTADKQRSNRDLFTLRNVLLALVGMAYLGIGYAATTMPHPPLASVLIGLLPLAAAAVASAWKSRARMLLVPLCIAVALAIALNLEQLRNHAAWVYFIQHAGAMTLLGITFGSTLGGTHGGALCSRMASLVIPEQLDANYLHYTWKVTLAWTVYFSISAVLSVSLFFFGPIEIWSVFANLLTPVSLGAMFVGEYLIRLRALPDGPRLSITATIQAYREYAQRQNTP